MAGSTFGTHFRITTWGESHGTGIGVVVDGCPAGQGEVFWGTMTWSPPM